MCTKSHMVPAFIIGLFFSVVAVAQTTQPGALSQVWAELDLTRPELAAVQSHVTSGDHAAAAEAWLSHCRQVQWPRWYWSRSDIDGLARTVREELSDEYRDAIDRAEIVMTRRYPSSCAPTVVELVQLGPNFSFMDNPTGDRQFLYTMHRHRFWDELGIAYVLTGDQRYPHEFGNQLERWLDELPLPATPPGKNSHDMWSGLDVGIRAYRWAWPYMCFLDTPDMTPERHARWLIHFAEHGRFLRKHHARVYSNWCTMQMYGLLTVSLMFPELKQSDEWRTYAVATLSKAIEAQVRPDGVHVEQSPTYHVGCIGWFADPMLLGERNGINWSASYRKRLEKMCEFTQWIVGPDGLLPALSDTDRNPRGLYALGSGALMFNRPDFAQRGKLVVRDVFIHGADAVNAFKQMPRQVPDKLVRHFSDAGYVVMRSGWDNRAGFATFDCGPRGGGHGHRDLLNLEIHTFGQLAIADPGRWWYDDSELRKAMLGTPAHNTISINGKNLSKFESAPKGEFGPLSVETRDGWTRVRGQHKAYIKLPGPPVCQRDVFWDGQQTWIVLDQVESPEPCDVLVNWQFATMAAERASDGVVVLGESGKPRTLVVHETRSDLTAKLDTWILSRVYGQQEPAVRLQLIQRDSRVIAATIIHGFEAADVPTAEISVKGSDPIQVQWRIGNAIHTIAVEGNGDWTCRAGG